MAKAYFEEIQCKTLINRVQGGMPFRWTINPYRGCQHACIYCFARSTHQYLGYNAGDDFDRRIVVKINAPEVLREELRRPGWRRELIALGTSCDPYEPAERRYQLTRKILELLRDHANPVSITTKSALVTRDLDLLAALSKVADCRVNFSVGTIDDDVWRKTEPGTPKPIKRMEAMQELVEAGVSAGVLMAPIIPGLSDSPESLEAVVKAASDHKAMYLAPNVLHLRPGSREWFMPFLREAYPHLYPEHQQAYKTSYAPREYTGAILEKVDSLRRKWRLGERYARPAEPRGQLTLGI